MQQHMALILLPQRMLHQDGKMLIKLIVVVKEQQKCGILIIGSTIGKQIK